MKGLEINVNFVFFLYFGGVVSVSVVDLVPIFLLIFHRISLYLLWLFFVEFTLKTGREQWLIETNCVRVREIWLDDETLDNHLVPIGSAFPRELCICLLDCFIWLDPPLCNRGVSVFFHVRPYYPPNLKKVTFLTCFITSIFLSFIKFHKSLRKQDGFVGS